MMLLEKTAIVYAYKEKKSRIETDVLADRKGKIKKERKICPAVTDYL
jgi:hypothetical protein